MQYVERMGVNDANEEMIIVLADQPASRLDHNVGRGRNKTVELGELGRQCSHICGAEGDQDEEPAAAVIFDPLTEAQMIEEQDCRAG